MQGTPKINNMGEGSASGATPEMRPPIVDLDQLFLLSAGDSAFQREMVEIFLVSAPDLVETMRRLASAEDVEDEWKQVAHKLAGSAAQIGAVRIMIEARNAEVGSAAPLQKKVEMVYNIESHLADFRQFFKLMYNLLDV